KPAVFLFDEPLSNLDAKLRVQMRTEIARLHASLGATMVYVTHDQVEAMTMGDRIVVLREGEIQQVAAPLVLYDRPANRFVAGFIGSPAMNFVEGRLVERSALDGAALGADVLGSDVLGAGSGALAFLADGESGGESGGAGGSEAGGAGAGGFALALPSAQAERLAGY